MGKRVSPLSQVLGDVQDILAKGRQNKVDDGSQAREGGDAAANERPRGGLSGVSALMREEEVGLRGENSALRAKMEALQAQLADQGVKRVETGLISASRFYNRFEMDLNEQADEEFKELVASIRTGGGNSIPALLNRIDGQEEKYELVYGHRRWAACRIVGVPLNAYVHEGLEPKVIARLQLIENSDRKDPSVLDRAKQIASQMESGAWSTQGELAKEVGISGGQVSKLLDIARYVPKTLQMAHPNHHKITFNQARALAKLGENSMALLKERIEEIRGMRASLSAEEATNWLLSGKKAADAGSKTKVVWTASPTGMTLKIRGLATARSLELSKRIEQLLSEYGLTESK